MSAAAASEYDVSTVTKTIQDLIASMARSFRRRLPSDRKTSVENIEHPLDRRRHKKYLLSCAGQTKSNDINSNSSIVVSACSATEEHPHLASGCFNAQPAPLIADGPGAADAITSTVIPSVRFNLPRGWSSSQLRRSVIEG